jgi:homocysteine S-methyltransferase
MTPFEAEQYHPEQISTLDAAGVDMITALTLNEADEAIGITRAAMSLNIPVVISFSFETDGTLLNGGRFKDAINKIDEATGNGPAYYMINCAHPTHFDFILDDQDWVKRIKGILANVSCKSHSELNNSEILEAGDALELASQNAELAKWFKHINVFGGCCCTNEHHVEEICKSVTRI